MRDKAGAARAGLQPVTEKTCLGCHSSTHEKPFRFAEAKAKIAHPTRPESATAAVGKRTALEASATADLETQYGMAASKGAKAILEELEVSYKNPVNLAFRPDGREVWAACEASGSVIVVDAARRVKVAEIPVGGQATDLVFSPDGTKAYVTSRLNDSVVVIDVATRKVLQNLPVADEPHGVAVDPTGRTLFVMGTAFDAVSVVDVATGKETKRLAASRNPWSAALSPDGRRLLVTNALSRFGKFRTPPVSEVTVLRRGRPASRGPLGRAGGEPAPRGRLAPERGVRPGHAQPHEEPGADDPDPPGLDDHERDRRPLEGRARRPAPARRAAALLRRHHRRGVHARTGRRPSSRAPARTRSR